MRNTLLLFLLCFISVAHFSSCANDGTPLMCPFECTCLNEECSQCEIEQPGELTALPGCCWHGEVNGEKMCSKTEFPGAQETCFCIDFGLCAQCSSQDIFNSTCTQCKPGYDVVPPNNVCCKMPAPTPSPTEAVPTPAPTPGPTFDPSKTVHCTQFACECKQAGEPTKCTKNAKCLPKGGGSGLCYMGQNTDGSYGCSDSTKGFARATEVCNSCYSPTGGGYSCRSIFGQSTSVDGVFSVGKDDNSDLSPCEECSFANVCEKCAFNGLLDRSHNVCCGAHDNPNSGGWGALETVMLILGILVLFGALFAGVVLYGKTQRLKRSGYEQLVNPSK